MPEMWNAAVYMGNQITPGDPLRRASRLQALPRIGVHDVFSATLAALKENLRQSLAKSLA